VTDLFLFSGCLISTRLPFLERSSAYVLEKLGIEFDPLPGASCCVEPIGLRSMSKEGWLAVAGRMLAIGELKGRDLLTLCNGCFVSLKEASLELGKGGRAENVKALLSEMGLEYGGEVKVIHLVELLDGRRSEIESLCHRSFRTRFAIHPGCHMIRPSHKLGVDSPYSPRILAELVSVAGGEVAYTPTWPPCCGGGLAGVNDDLSAAMLNETTGRFVEAGAQTIVTPCPFCFVQFDMRQRGGLPVLHISELLALALGAEPEKMGLQYHRTKVDL